MTRPAAESSDEPGVNQDAHWVIQMEKVNLAEKFNLFDDYWNPRIVGELNGSYLKLAKLKGEFVWHKHDNEDELFLVTAGRLLIRLRDREISLEPGEFTIIPRGVEHLPIAREEAHVLTPGAEDHTQHRQCHREPDREEPQVDLMRRPSQ